MPQHEAMIVAQHLANEHPLDVPIEYEFLEYLQEILLEAKEAANKIK